MALLQLNTSTTRLLRLVCFMGFLVLSGNLAAQLEVPGFEIRRIGVQNGLRNQIITSVAKDASHAIWIGTQSGLYKYDGFKITRIDTYIGILPLQNFSNITDLTIDESPNGVLFVCSKYKAKIIDPYSTETLTAVSCGMPDSLYRNFCQIEKNSSDTYLALHPNGIYKISKAGNRWYQCECLYDIPYFEFSPLNMVVDQQDPEAVWLLFGNDIVWHASPKGVEKYKLPNYAKKITETSGLLQLVYTPKGLFGWDLARNIYKYDQFKRQFIFANHLISLYEIEPNLAAVDIAMKQRECLRCAINFEMNQVVLGTTLGLFIVRKKGPRFQSIEALQEEELRGIYADSSGQWAASTYYGFYTGRFDKKTVLKRPEIRDIWDFLPLSPNRLLLGQGNIHKRLLWDPVQNVFIDSINTQQHDTRKTPNLLAMCLEKDPYGKIWMGGLHNLWWAPADSLFAFRPYNNAIDSNDQLNISNIRALLSDRDSTLWVGAGEGLFQLRYNPALQQYLPASRVSLIGKVPVSDLYEDRFENLWIASKGKGLAKFDKISRQLSWYNMESGMCDSMICRIESSHHDSVLWLSTHNGLSRMDVHACISHNFYEEDGFQGNEFNSAASTRCPDGTLLFGGVTGLIYFQPEAIAVGKYRYETSVLYVQLYNKGLDTLIPLNLMPNGLHTSPYPELLEFVLGSNELIHPEKMQYRYRMLGLSDKWHYITGENKVKFVRLPPGHYAFQVQAIPLEGHVGGSFTLPVWVETPFYENRWFRALMLGILVLIAYGAYRYRLWQIHKEQLIRQQVADDLHDDIGNKLNIIGIVAQKIDVFMRKNKVTLPTENALEKLLELSRDTQISLLTMIWAVDPSKDRFENLITRMQDFADDFVRPVIHQFHFTAPATVPDRDVSLRVRHHLMLIYQELLVNTLKHTNSIQINVDVYLHGEKLIVVLSNHHRPDLAPPFNISSGNRGKSTLNRRLIEINGVLTFEETSSILQKTTLTVPRIFKTS